MRFGHLELPVSNPLESMSFYVDMLGFRLVTNQADRFIWVQAGEQELLLKPAGPASGAGDAETGPFAERRNVCLYTDDLRRDVARLREAGVGLESGEDGCFYFRDPDGHQFQIVDPRSHQ